MVGLMKYWDGQDRLIIDYDGDDTKTKHAIIPDGAVLRIPLMLADTAIPQQVMRDSDEWSSEQAYASRKQNIANRWRSNPPNAAAPAVPFNTPRAMPAARPDNDEYHAARLRRLENRWKEGV